MHRTSHRQTLRSGTSVSHLQLESVVGSLRTIDDYARYLRASMAFRAPIERALQTVVWPEMFGAWRPTQIADVLARDLADIGAPQASLESNTETPAVSFDTPALLGTLYVLEGSALGARLLLRDAAKLNLSAQHGAAHLARQASSDTWRSFVGIVDGAPDEMMPFVLRAANGTFTAARRAFTDLDDANKTGC